MNVDLAAMDENFINVFINVSIIMAILPNNEELFLFKTLLEAVVTTLEDIQNVRLRNACIFFKKFSTEF